MKRFFQSIWFDIAAAVLLVAVAALLVGVLK